MIRIEFTCQFSLILAAMAGKTQLFHSLWHSYRILGLYSPKTNQSHLFNWKVIFSLSFMVLMFMTSFAFFLWEAETLDDYGTSFYESLAEVSSVHNFMMNVWRTPLIIELVKNFEDFIESSK